MTVNVEACEEMSDFASAQLVPYRNGHEHIADLLARHDLLLKREIARGHARTPADILGFVAITEQEVQRLLSLPEDSSSAESEAIDRALQSMQRQISARVEQSLAHRVRLPLVELAKCFALSAAEIDILFACLAAELNRRYERVYGFLHDDMSHHQPSPGLVLSLYWNSSIEQLKARVLLSSLAPLRYFRLLEVQEDGLNIPWLSRSMRMDERVVSYLLGDTAIDGRIARYVVRTEVPRELSSMHAHQRDSIDELLKQLVHWTSVGRKKPIVHFHGTPSTGADALAKIAAAHLGVPLLTLDAELLAEAGDTPEQILFLLFREGLLSRAAIFLRNIDRVLDVPAGATHHRTLLRCITEMGNVVFTSGTRSWSWPMPPDPMVLHAIEVRPAGPIEQVAAWRSLSRGQIPEDQLHRLVSLNPLPVDAIARAWSMAEGISAAESSSTGVSIEHLRRACRTQAGVPANSLAHRIEPRHGWNDLVLPTAQREQLQALCSQARHSSIVYGQWGFERKLSLGRGLNVLFCGPPGTGKTMAAEVIAADLGVDLFKIDLSQVASKYIGETEKNLRQLFDQAASANAILFFDEADALLGKRSEVKDAHDRYANTETAYLLQKMEEYPGIAILSTNFRQNLDEAFTRRMRFCIEFTLPEDEDRLRIWRTVWPIELPRAPDVDLVLLSRLFRFSGGSIRNVALAAAFIAAERKEVVSMKHIMRAARLELQKMGRLVNEQELQQRVAAESRQ